MLSKSRRQSGGGGEIAARIIQEIPQEALGSRHFPQVGPNLQIVQNELALADSVYGYVKADS